MLRRSGARHVVGRTSRTADYSMAKAARVAEREAAESRRRDALDELDRHRGPLDRVRLSDAARDELLEVYAGCLAQAVGGTGSQRSVPGKSIVGGIPLTGSALHVAPTPGTETVLLAPSGRLAFVDRTLSIVEAAGALTDDAGDAGRAAGASW